MDLLNAVRDRSPTRDNLALCLLGVLAFLPILLRVYWPVGEGFDTLGYPIGRDFINYWGAPRLAFSGRVATLFDLDAYHAAIGTEFGAPVPFHNWSYPPVMLLLLWPLAQAPYFVALASWTLILFGAFAGVTLSQIPAESRTRALIMLGLAPACLINIVGGQNGFLTASLFLGGLLVLDRRPILAGILFGLLTFKPQLGLILPFALVALGAWRAIFSAALTTLGLVGASILVFGTEPWHHYLVETRVIQYAFLVDFAGFYTVMMTSIFAGARVFGLTMTQAWAVQLAVSLPVLVLSVWAMRRTRDPRLRASVLAVAATLLTPYALNYDLTAVTAALTWLLFPAKGGEFSSLPLRLAWLLPLMIMPMHMIGFGGGPLILVVLFAVLIREVASEASPTVVSAVPATALA